ncbi:MAG: hypothetical protein Devi2KO_22730 [Devosia indica]
MGNGCVDMVMLAAIGEAVWRDVENAHDKGTSAEDQRRTIAEGDGVGRVHELASDLCSL